MDVQRDARTEDDAREQQAQATHSARKPGVKGTALLVHKYLWGVQSKSEEKGIVARGKPFAFPSQLRIANEVNIGGKYPEQRVREKTDRLEALGVLDVGRPQEDEALRRELDALVAKGLLKRPHNGWGNIYWVKVDPTRLDEVGLADPLDVKRRRRTRRDADRRERRRRRRRGKGRGNQPRLFSESDDPPRDDPRGSADQPQRGSADQPQRGSADQPQRGSADQPQRASADQPQRASADQPHGAPLERLRSEGPQSGTDGERSGPAAARLAELWLKVRRGPLSGADDRKGLAQMFDELLRLGVTEPAITAEITRSDRPKFETIWDFARRLSGSRQPANQRGASYGKRPSERTKYRFREEHAE